MPVLRLWVLWYVSEWTCHVTNGRSRSTRSNYSSVVLEWDLKDGTYPGDFPVSHSLCICALAPRTVLWSCFARALFRYPKVVISRVGQSSVHWLCCKYIAFISPRILKESWRAIMIVCGVRLFVCLLVVCLFVCNAFCPPMLSLNNWRYAILVKTKKFRLDE